MSRRVREVGERYGSLAEAYERWWAPVLVVLAEPLLAELPHASRAIDLGCGVGTVGRRLRAAAVLGADASFEMAARAPFPTVVADIERLPFVEAAADIAISTFVLQHIPSPVRVFRAGHRILSSRGVMATATWGVDHRESGGPYALVEAVLDKVGAPHDPLTTASWHARVDSAAKMRRIARAAGFSSVRAWDAEGSFTWTPESFFGWASTMGQYGRRFALLDRETRNRALEEVGRGLAGLNADDLVWRPSVVYCVCEKR